MIKGPHVGTDERPGAAMKNALKIATKIATKNVRSIHRGGEEHWGGDGFPVHTVFSYQDLGAELTPFLLLDHAGPADFGPTVEERGVGWHPHRGFEDRKSTRLNSSH